MNRACKCDWVRPLLEDLSAFLSANNMPDSVRAIEAAALAIEAEQRGPRPLAATPPISKVFGANVLPFPDPPPFVR